MRPPSSTVLAFAVTFCGLSAACYGESPATQPTTRPVSIQDIRAGGVTGLLGVRLGTMVTVTGKAVPNTSLRKADGAERIVLQISAVNGVALPKPVEYPFRKVREFVRVTEPKVGATFTFRGFETGGFEGIPLNYGASWQDIGFYFKSEFLIVPND